MESNHKRTKTDSSKPRKKSKRKSVYSPNSPLLDAPTASISDKPKSPAHISQILSSLNKNILFTCLEKEQRKVVVHHMKSYSIQANETVFEQDDPAFTFFVVISGRLNVIVNQSIINILNPGDSFGELALIHDTPRTATIESIEPVVMWGLDRETFRHAVEFVNQEHLEENKAFIESVPLLSKLRKQEKEALLKGVCTLKYDTGARIVKEGDSGDMLYIIKEGLVTCSIEGNEIRYMGPGDFFGEQAMLFSCSRTASITAVDVVKCLSLSRQKLGKIFGKSLLTIIYQNSLRMAIERSEKLSLLSKDEIDRVMAAVKIQSFKQGQVVVPYGSAKNRQMWIILFGKLENHLGGSFDSFRIIGDSDIIRNSPAVYDYNILAKQHSDIGIITKELFEEAIGGEYEKVMLRLEALDAIRNVQLFKGLPKDRYYSLVGVLKELQTAEGEIVTIQGSFETRFIIVKKGGVDVFMDEEKLISLGPYDTIGEKSLIANEPSLVTSIASQDSTLYVLEQEDYIRLVDESTRVKLMRKLQLQDDSISLDDLVIVKELGKGSFGNVYLTYHKYNQLFYALKTISRKKIQAFGIQDQLLLERQILFQLEHHLILKLFKTFKDKYRLYFLEEYVTGSELFDVLRVIGPLSENNARFYSACLIEIIQHLHERNIIYRDLKPENVIVDEEGYLKLLDFGTAKFLENGRTYTQIGTPHYMSPEAISGKGYGFPSDYWSIGVMIFEFMCGTLPFGVQYDDPMMIYKSILKNKITYPVIFDETCGAKALIEELLNKDPQMRAEGSIASAKIHPWFRYFDWLNFQIREVTSPYKPPASTVAEELEMAVHFSADIREKILEDETSAPTPKRVRRGKKAVDKDWDQNF